MHESQKDIRHHIIKSGDVELSELVLPAGARDDWLPKVLKSPAFWPAVTVALGIFACFWTLLVRLPDLWVGGDGYYSHGFLVPLISGYIVYKRWDRIKDIPVKPGYIALIPLLALMVLVRAAQIADVQLVLSFAFVFALMLAAWFVAGWKWMMALAPAILFLIFMLPIWTTSIENYTNPVQIKSTQVANAMLQLSGFNTHMDEYTTIFMDNFKLNVGVPCSGLKLLFAVTAFTVFFMLIAGLKWWANILMVAFILPLCLFVNGLRIALIGVVGETMGEAAGMQFHDWSGYITLLVCFFILFKFARLLGWKD